MELATALQIAKDIAAMQTRWGKHYSITADYTSSQVGEVIAALVTSAEDLVPKEQLTVANRQLAAAKARETHLRNQIEELRKDYKDTQRELNTLRSGK